MQEPSISEAKFILADLAYEALAQILLNLKKIDVPADEKLMKIYEVAHKVFEEVSFFSKGSVQ